ncbi:hypothetical protein Holit_00677 [Hollandina sp. SP2]
MSEKKRVSTLMLERYHLGELSPGEREQIEAELRSGDSGLGDRLSALNASDQELRFRYPAESLPLLNRLIHGEVLARRRRPFLKKVALAAVTAAALFLCVFFPVLYFRPGESPGAVSAAGGTDRIKGAEMLKEPKLFVYLKNEFGESRFPEQELKDGTLLREGNTVQLAYAVPAGAARYGVIFSIDGRSAVTLHYPYREGQSALLTAGKKIFLHEAYTLDDAPELELFFMVLSDKTLDPVEILTAASGLARNPQAALAESEKIFRGYEVAQVIIKKPSGKQPAGTQGVNHEELR